MAESYEHLIGTPINPDDSFFKDGSQVTDENLAADIAKQAMARQVNQNMTEERYAAYQQRNKKKKNG